MEEKDKKYIIRQMRVIADLAQYSEEDFEKGKYDDTIMQLEDVIEIAGSLIQKIEETCL